MFYTVGQYKCHKLMLTVAHALLKMKTCLWHPLSNILRSSSAFYLDRTEMEAT